MTAPPSIDMSAWLHEQLAQASPDLLRAMVSSFAQALMSADAEAVCGPAILAVAGRRGAESSARSTSRSSGPCTSSRQKVSVSRTTSTVQPRPRAAATNSSRARVTLPAPGRVKKSKSWVGRAVRCCASRAAPPASRKCSLAGRAKNSWAMSNWNGVRPSPSLATTRCPIQP